MMLFRRFGKKYFETLLNSSRNNNVDTYTRQNLNNYENFKDYDNLICDDYKFAYLIVNLTKPGCWSR